MLKPQKRTTKKELKRDPLLDSMLKAQQYYEDNKSRITYILGAIVAVVLIIFLFNYFVKQSEQQASALLGKAQVEYDALNYSKARVFLENLVTEYSGSDAALQGTFLLANLNFNENNYAEAKNLFKEFIDSYSGSNILLASGYAGYAACLSNEGSYSEAAEYYEEAQEIVGDFNMASEYLYLAGLNYQNANDMEKAKETFNKIIKEYEDSPLVFNAEAKLILLNKS